MQEHLNKRPVRFKQNVTKLEKQPIAQLKQNQNIIIKPANKGASIVIQNTQDYKDECLRQLNNKNHYEIMNKDATLPYYKEIQKTLEDGYT